MGLRSVEQVIEEAQILKEKILNIDNITNDEDGLVCQQNLQTMYHDALICDLECSLDNKVEVDLWNHGFRNSIVSLQSQARDKKNPKRDESECKLTQFLESATAFYSGLLHDICAAFDLELPFRRNSLTYGAEKKTAASKAVSRPNKNSCYYICQYCLVHLGDLARYRCLVRQAELFYRYAVQLSPCNGHPYNQLALVEASRGDRLSTVFYYVRSVSVRHPFPAAAVNLSRTLNQCVDEQINVEGRVKLSVSECVTVFLKFHGMLSELTDLALAEKYVNLLTNTLTALVATESFSSGQLVQMLAINLYALHQKRGSAFLTKKTVLADTNLGRNELEAKRLVLHLVAGSLSAFLLPVYTLKDGESLLDYFALPAIKMTLDWIHLESDMLFEAAFLRRRQIWPSLCKLLNVIQPNLFDFSSEKWTFVPLPEDRNLQGFIPLENALGNYRFTFDEPKMDTATANKLRAFRLVEFGRWLSSQEKYNLLKRSNGEKTGSKDLLVFELAYANPVDVVQKAEGAQQLPSITSSATHDAMAGILKVAVPSSVSPPTEAHTGVSAEIPTQAPSPAPGIMKKYRQNVAMQAILKKMDQESSKGLEAKQVTFKTPSPVETHNTIDIEKKTQPKQPKTWQEKQQVHSSLNKNLNFSTDKNTVTLNSQEKCIADPVQGFREKFTASASLESFHTRNTQELTRTIPPLKNKDKCSVDSSITIHTSGKVDCSTVQNQDQKSPQKKLLAYPEEKVLSFDAPGFQNRGAVFSTPVTGDKSMSFPLGEAAVSPFESRWDKNPASKLPLHSTSGQRDNSVLYSTISHQELATTKAVKENVSHQGRKLFSHQDLATAEMLQSVAKMSPEIFKNPTITLPSGQEIVNVEKTPLATSVPYPLPFFAPQMDENFSLFSRPGDVISDSPNVHTVIGSEHVKFEYPHSKFPLSQQRPNAFHQLSDEMQNSPTYGVHHMPNPAVAWWKNEESAGYRNSHTHPTPNDWWKMKATTGLQPVENVHYNFMGHHTNDTATSNDKPLVSESWSMNSTSAPVEVNLHHKLVGSGSQKSGLLKMPLFATPEQGQSEGFVHYSTQADTGNSTYSLFSSTPWATQTSQCGLGFNGLLDVRNGPNQSLWSGPGPSPLERLLEQQKQLREGPAPKGGT